MTQEQLVVMGMLVGTDFNPGGVKGIGPKKALTLVKQHSTPAAVFDAAAWDKQIEQDAASGKLDALAAEAGADAVKK